MITTNATQHVAAVLLAAGESKRAGTAGRPVHKLLLEIDGEPLVRRSARRIVACGFAEVVVVLGHQAERIEQTLSDLPIRMVENPDYRDGQQTSVRVGLASLRTPVDGVMICLADQPALTTDDLLTLARAFANRSHGEVVVPFVDGRRGNPIVLSRTAAERILERGGRFGCRRFVEDNADLVERIVLDDLAYVTDVDLPSDIVALERGDAG